MKLQLNTKGTTFSLSCWRRWYLIVFSVCIIILLCGIQQSVAFYIMSDNVPQSPATRAAQAALKQLLSSSAAPTSFPTSFSLSTAALFDEKLALNSKINLNSKEREEAAAIVATKPDVSIAVERSLTAGQMVINSVPEEDRGIFITYQLARALITIGEPDERLILWNETLSDKIIQTETNKPNLKDIEIYDNFPLDLLNWIMEEFHLSEEDVYYQLRSRSQMYCTTDGVCYTSNDLGCFCCPF